MTDTAKATRYDLVKHRCAEGCDQVWHLSEPDPQLAEQAACVMSLAGTMREIVKAAREVARLNPRKSSIEWQILHGALFALAVAEGKAHSRDCASRDRIYVGQACDCAALAPGENYGVPR